MAKIKSFLPLHTLALGLAVGCVMSFGASAQLKMPLPKQKPDMAANATGFKSIGSTATGAAKQQTAQKTANATSGKKVNRYVVDQAAVMSKEAEFRLTKALASFQKEHDTQVVFMTTKSLQGFKIDDYTAAVSKQWDVAARTEKPGILVVLAPNEKFVKIHVGPGMERWMSDRLADHVIAAYMIPSFQSNDWENGLIRGAAGIISVVGRDGPLTEADVDKVIANHKVQVAQAAQAQAAAQNQAKPVSGAGVQGVAVPANTRTSTDTATQRASAKPVRTSVTSASSNQAVVSKPAVASSGFSLGVLLWPLLLLLLAAIGAGLFFMKGRKVATLVDEASDDVPASAETA